MVYLIDICVSSVSVLWAVEDIFYQTSYLLTLGLCIFRALTLDYDFGLIDLLYYLVWLLHIVFWSNDRLSFHNIVLWGCLVVWHRLVLLITTCPFMLLDIYIVNLLYLLSIITLLFLTTCSFYLYFLSMYNRFYVFAKCFIAYVIFDLFRRVLPFP